jgi:multiple sugar transport system permease protein
MTAVERRAPATLADAEPARRRAVSRRRAGRAGYLFVSGYTALLLAFGVFPTLYAVYLAFTNDRGQFTGLNQFVKVVQDYRFVPAFANIAIYLVMWLVLVVVLTVLVAVLLRGGSGPGCPRSSGSLLHPRRAGRGGQRAGLAVHAHPDGQPGGPLLRWLGFDTFAR